MVLYGLTEFVSVWNHGFKVNFKKIRSQLSVLILAEVSEFPKNHFNLPFFELSCVGIDSDQHVYVLLSDLGEKN